MATSGSVEFADTRNNLITDAYYTLNIGTEGESLPAADLQYGARVLNRMVKQWATHGIHLWKQDEIVVYLTVGTEKYTLPTANSSLLSDTVVTKLNGDHSSGATSLTVDDTTGMAASDNIGVVVDDGSIHWTTISSVDSTTTLTIASGIDDDAADDSVVYTYTNAIVRPLRIIDGRRRDWTPALPIDTPFVDGMISRSEYLDLPQKKGQGKPNQGYYDPRLSAGDLYLWNAPDSSSETFIGTALLPIEDFDAASNNPDLPQEWLEALVYNLARRLMIRHPNVAAQTRQDVKEMAVSTLAQVNSWDSEPGSVFMQPQYEVG